MAFCTAGMGICDIKFAAILIIVQDLGITDAIFRDRERD